MVKLCSKRVKRTFGRGRKPWLTIGALCKWSVDGLCDCRVKPHDCLLTDEEYTELPEITKEEAWQKIFSLHVGQKERQDLHE